jgi:hypothetical protein
MSNVVLIRRWSDDSSLSMSTAQWRILWCILSEAKTRSMVLEAPLVSQVIEPCGRARLSPASAVCSISASATVC